MLQSCKVFCKICLCRLYGQFLLFCGFSCNVRKPYNCHWELFNWYLSYQTCETNLTMWQAAITYCITQHTLLDKNFHVTNTNFAISLMVNTLSLNSASLFYFIYKCLDDSLYNWNFKNQNLLIFNSVNLTKAAKLNSVYIFILLGIHLRNTEFNLVNLVRFM